MNWVLLQLAMIYYGDSLKKLQIDNDQICISIEYLYLAFIILMKLFTQFSIPNPDKADLAKTNRTSKIHSKLVKK